MSGYIAYRVCDRIYGSIQDFDSLIKAEEYLEDCIEDDAENLMQYGISTDKGYIDNVSYELARKKAESFYFIETVED